MSVTRAGAREMPVTAKTIAVGSWKARKSSPGIPRWAKSCSVPMFTAKKKTGMIKDGTITSGSRGNARSARIATDQRSARKLALRARMAAEGRLSAICPGVARAISVAITAAPLPAGGCR